MSTEFSDGTAEENVFEHGLADRFLSIYLPIHAAGGGEVIGAYEVYEDAAPIVADIAQTRQDVLLIVGAHGARAPGPPLRWRSRSHRAG